MNKKGVCKLRPGTFVEVLWKDAPPEVAMVVEKPTMQKGDMAVKLFYPKRKVDHVDNHAVHTQINRVLGNVHIPDPVSPPETRLK